MATTIEIPEEFKKVSGDFIADILRTFPEYKPLIQKWWKDESSFSHIEDETERVEEYNKRKEKDTAFLYKFCSKKYPPRFFEILNQSTSIFEEDSEVDTEFLPFIHFKNIWQDDITDDTRETIWKYLQLILFSVVGNVKDKDVFGDAGELFENMDEDDFKDKLNNALDEIKGIFDNKTEEGEESSFPQHSADDIHSHLQGMFTGKLGDLAREIAEETAGEINMDADGETDVNKVFQKMFKNPGQLMNLVQSVGGKLEEKIKSGDITEAELMKEASQMMGKMKEMPGMGDIQSMLNKMGMNLGGGKVNMKATEQKMKQEMKKANLREQVKKQAELNKMQRELASMLPKKEAAPPKYTDDELIAMMEAPDTNIVEKENSEEKPKKKVKKKKPKKKSQPA